MKNALLCLSILALVFTSLAQESSIPHEMWCTTSHKMNAMLKDKDGAKILQNDEIIRAQELANGMISPKGTIYYIPVVFHILHNGGLENVSEEQIFNALDVMNRDFRLQNEDTSDVLTEFKPIMGDVEIEFVLATKAPNGECFRGYTRTNSPLTFVGDDGGAQVDAIRNGNDIFQGNWPANKYLNVFVIADAGGAGGYTNYPYGSGSDMSAGIWILHTQFGEIGTSSLGGGRSMTHECGHWFNLPHTWGSSNTPGIPSNCGMDDGVADTPLTAGVPGGCPVAQNDCGPTANVQNYMDYALSCQSMFTQGQAERMRTAVLSSVGGRNNLWSPQNRIDTGTDLPPTLCNADFKADKLFICAGSQITFTDESYNAPNGWMWAFNGGTPSTSIDENPVITYNTPGLYEVTLIATDGAINDIETKTGYIRVLPDPIDLPIYDGFENYSSLSDIEQWGIINNDNNSKFELETSFGLTGNKCVRLINYSQPSGSYDELIAAPIDLSSLDPLSDTLTLSFRYAYKRKNINDDDWFRVYVSTDCGDTWNVRRTRHSYQISEMIQSSYYVPGPQADWVTVHMVNITSGNWVENFMYKFTFESGGGNNLYLDNINIYASAPSDNIVGLVENNSLGGLSVYPNPVEDELSVKFEMNLSQDAIIQIQDIAGKIVQRSQIQTNVGTNIIFVDTRTLASGMYFLKLQVGGNDKTVQFVVE